jgi:pimeloyl-ACP methyl ester carboxylesterase
VSTDGESTSPEAYLGGDGPTVVLLHGLNMSWHIWRPVIPLLTERFRVYAPTLPGHRGGPGLHSDGHASILRLTGMMREQLAATGIDRAHMASNSLGGAVALRLAEAGAARSVTAFSPAGGWRNGSDFHRLAMLLRMSRLSVDMPWAAGMLTLPAARKRLMRSVMEHPEELPAAEFAELTADLRACRVLEPLLRESARSGPMKPVIGAGVPVRIAWPERDRTIGFDRYGAPLLENVPDPEVIRLRGVGHVPMYDDPALVAGAIAEFVEHTETTRTPRRKRDGS